MAPSGWCQRFSLACHCSSQYPSSPGFLCCFAWGLGCATLLCLWLCAHLLSGLGFPMLPDYPLPSIRLWVYWLQWLLFSTRVPYLRDGVTPAGSSFVCPQSKRRCSVPVWVRSTGQFLVGPHASVCGVSARPVPPGVLPDGPPCVYELRLSFAPSCVLPCPMLGFRVASAALAAGLGLSWAPCPSSASWGFVPRLVARLAPCSRWRPLTVWSSLKLRVVGGSWFSPLCSPGCRSASRSTFSALPPVSRLFWACSLLLWVRLRPLPDDSLGALWLPVRLLWSSMRLRVCEGFFPLCLVLPLQGSVTFLALVPRLGALSESLTLSIPRSFLVVALSASAVGFAVALWLCPERALSRFLCVGLVDRSCRIVAPLAPCLC